MSAKSLSIRSTASPEAKASAKDTRCSGGSAFERLPDEIIEQILKLTTPNSFASLILLNRKWRMVSQQAYLYCHHLSNCLSYTAAHHLVPTPDDEDSLPRLRRQFAHEIKRNLFEAYLRPRETVINLVSTSISSSSAPGGEAFHFSLSARGNYVLAYSSSRIHVLDVTGPDVEVKRELKILRRPASTTIADDGSLLAVLSTDLQVDLYDLKGEHPKHTGAVELDHTPRTIALSPTGSVLAAAYDSGVEVSSLDPGCLSSDRRAVKCYAVDSLSFSQDGTQILGTTLQSRNPSTVVLTAPYYNPGSQLPEESISSLWTTSILFPNGSRDCSHAVLLPSPLDDEASWTFTYDRVFETFRAVRIDDLRNGTTYFTGPTADVGSASHLLPSTLPAASDSGDLVAAGFQGSIWLYGVPEDLDAPPIVTNASDSNTDSEISTPLSPLGHRNSSPSLRSINRQPSNSRIPQWQVLCDRFRNTFIEGRKISSLDGVSAMTWVGHSRNSFHSERLVAVAPGVVTQSPISDDDGMSPTDGGRISILDFDYCTSNGKSRTITIEVGQNEPDILEEEHRDLDAEVAIVRRRTVAQRRGNNSNITRAATTITHLESLPMPITHDLSETFGLPLSIPLRRANKPLASLDLVDTASIDEDQEALDAPYSHTSPRSGITLRRAATVAAINRRLHPRVVVQEQIEYRRADGRNDHPHESDADNWVPPPPPYSREPVPALPEHIQKSINAQTATVGGLQLSSSQRDPLVDSPITSDSGSLHRSRTTLPPANRQRRFPFHRTLSDSTTRTAGGTSVDEDALRPATSPVSNYIYDFDDIYDVSPPGTPRPTHRRPSGNNQIPRRPVGSNTSPSSATAISVSSSAMSATLQQPVSPIPEPASEILDDRLLELERSTASDGTPPTNMETTPAAAVPTSHRMNEAGPPVPNDRHRLTHPPSVAEIILKDEQIPDDQISPLPRKDETVPTLSPFRIHDPERLTIWKRSETAPATLVQMSTGPSSPGIVMPSADQLVRLNSRRGRPPSLVLADPSRRSSGTFNQPLVPFRGPSPRRSSENIPPQLTSDQAFRSSLARNTASAHRSPLTSNTGYSRSYGPSSSSQSPFRRKSQGIPNSRHTAPSSSPGRPVMQRLETIRSVSSTGEPSPFINQKPMGLGRQMSRAERSAAKNIKDAKRRGWRASTRKDKKKAGDGASSAGWTDVSHDSGSWGREKGGGKCVVM